MPRSKAAYTRRCLSLKIRAAIRFKSSRVILAAGWPSRSRRKTSLYFARHARLTKLNPVVIHCNYLVNLAAADEEMLQKSRRFCFAKKLSGQFCCGADYLLSIQAVRAGLVKPTAYARALGSLKFACRRLKFWRVENSSGEHCGTR